MPTESCSIPDTAAQDILDFWFGPATERGRNRAAWFRKDPVFDEEIRQRFGAVQEVAAAGHLQHWQTSVPGCLALVVALDQFPRNLFRGQARAFASDDLARATARHALAEGYDQQVLPVERTFFYLPLEHSESLADQEQCVALMKTLSVYPETENLWIWAEKHRVIIERFGRFPHRNEALGRASTAEEIEFLKQPGSGF